MRRWDAERQRWVDDGWPAPGGDAGANAWAAAETQTALPRPTSPEPEPPRRPPRLVGVIVAAALLGGAAGVGVWALFRDDLGHRAGAGPTPTAVASASPDPAGTTTPRSPKSSTEPRPPKSSTAPRSPGPSTEPGPGYTRVHDPVGYTVDVPAGWTRTAHKPRGKPAVVTHTSPDRTRVLQFFEVSEASAADSLDLAEHDPGFGFGRLPGYRALERTAGEGWSEIVYRFDGAELGPRQVVDHRFRAADGMVYGILSSAPEELPRAQVTEPVTVALSSFCPRGTTCRTG